MTSPDPAAAERRSRLLGLTLRTLVADHVGTPVADPVAFPNGAALLHRGQAWVLIDGPASRALGGALAWALRQRASSLHVVASSDTGLLARRAEQFRFPIEIWFRDERTLLAAVAEPLAPPVGARTEHLALTGMIEAAGAFANVEHGVVFGEVRGLEVCRVVDQPTLGRLIEGGELGATHDAESPAGVQLEVGVGVNDREAFRLLHGDVPTVDTLAAVVGSVETHRHVGAPQHPLNRLAQERMLRWRLERDPALAGMRVVHPAQPPLPRPNLKDPVPCVASGVTVDGLDAAIVCTHGVDLDLVGYVADVQIGRDVRVVVAAPSRDLVPIAVELLDLLADPVAVIAVD